jgi:hypothetical protein
MRGLQQAFDFNALELAQTPKQQANFLRDAGEPFEGRPHFHQNGYLPVHYTLTHP